MSQTRHFPIYVARFPNNEGCGHQHNRRYLAWRCASNMLRKRQGIAWAEVVKISFVGTQYRERVMGHALNTREACTECGNILLRPDDDHEWGHADGCALMAD